MYFISRGSVEVVSETGAVLDTMSAGEAFGELALLYNTTRTASLRAKVNTDLFMLSKTDLDVLMERYSSIKPQIYKIANERLAIVMSRYAPFYSHQPADSHQPAASASVEEYFTPSSSLSTASNEKGQSDGSFSSVNPTPSTRRHKSDETTASVHLDQSEHDDAFNGFDLNQPKQDPKIFLESGRSESNRDPRDVTIVGRSTVGDVVGLDQSVMLAARRERFLEFLSEVGKRQCMLVQCDVVLQKGCKFSFDIIR